MAVAPLAAVATLMLGLRVGAGDAVRAAVVFGAPLGDPAADGTPRLAWQLLTLLDDRGVRETIAMRGLQVTARANGREATWSGDTNEDGIAEMSFALPGLTSGMPLDLVVRADGEALPLAEGRVRWEDVPRRASRTSTAARPAKRVGPVELDVLVDGERLVTGFDSDVWIRARLGAGIPAASVALAIAPEPGLDVASPSVTLCEGEGDGAVRWAHTKMRAMGHITGVGIEAVAGGRTVGEWFGALPVAAGAFQPTFSRAVPRGGDLDVQIRAPNPRTVVYAEVDDERGRVAAAALRVEDGAHFRAPALGDGLHWLVVSGEPRGAETLGGAAMAWPFVVGPVASVDTGKACSLGPWLLARGAEPFPRWTALDGLPARSSTNRKRRAAGLAIAIVSLVAAVVIEVILLGRAAREAREAMARVTAEDETGHAREAMARRPTGGSFAVAVLLVVLGFALLAALVLAKG